MKNSGAPLQAGGEAPIRAIRVCGYRFELTLTVFARRMPPAAVTHRPVLIVEDDAELRDMMAHLLELEGFQARAVANGAEALRYLDTGDTPNVILLDLMMPVMDGWEFRRRQAANPAVAHVPVIILSALDQARAATVSAAAFLKKPLDFDRLLQLVRQYCQ